MNIAKLFSLLLFLFCLTAFGQTPSISEGKRIRYLKKIEKKNRQYVFTEKKKNGQLLDKLTINENKLTAFKTSDFSINKSTFESLKSQLNNRQLTDTSVNSNEPLLLADIPVNLDYQVKDYLMKQITMFHYLTDSVPDPSTYLKKQAEQTKRNILETEKQLAALQAIEKKTQSHREELKQRYKEFPAAQKELNKIDKNSYYFTQGMNGFKGDYISPASGIENSLFKSLSYNTDYVKFAGNLSAAQGIPNAPNGVANLNGLQTKTQVQALLPQNAQGITAEQKAQLVANMSTSLTKFQKLRDKRPNISALKDRPNFKANPYKGLPLKQRIQFGKELQVHAANKYYPIIVDVGLTLGFKLTARITPLIGASYKLGFGNDVTHIRLSSEGMIVKGGFDFKIAYGFSMQCLYEETFKFIPKMINERPAAMQEPSFIIGIMNKCKISKKTCSTIFFGYDFLYNQHTPYTTPWIIRVGWQ